MPFSDSSFVEKDRKRREGSFVWIADLKYAESTVCFWGEDISCCMLFSCRIQLNDENGIGHHRFSHIFRVQKHTRIGQVGPTGLSSYQHMGLSFVFECRGVETTKKIHKSHRKDACWKRKTNKFQNWIVLCTVRCQITRQCIVLRRYVRQ